MRVSDIMKTDVYSVKPYDSLTSVAKILCRTKVSGISVIDDDGKAVGVVSEKDLLRAMYPSYEEFWESPGSFMDFEAMEERYQDIWTKRVSDVMSSQIITVPPDMPILKAASLLIRKRIRRAPVIENDRVVGVVSQGDIHQAIFRRECAL